MTTSEQKQFVNNENRGGNPMKKLLKKRLNQKGLTLIELLAVIVILAIIAAIAIPAIGNIINKQRDKAVLSDASGIISAAKIAYADGACGEDNICDNTDKDETKRELKDYLDKKLKNPETVKVTLGNDGKWTLVWKSGHTFKVVPDTVDNLEDGDAAGVGEQTIIDAMDK